MTVRVFEGLEGLGVLCAVWALCCVVISLSLVRYEHPREASHFLIGAMGFAATGVLLIMG